MGRKRASGYQGGSFAASLHSDACDFDGAPGSVLPLLTSDSACEKIRVLPRDRVRSAGVPAAIAGKMPALLQLRARS
jgi:hypothetical protein